MSRPCRAVAAAAITCAMMGIVPWSPAAAADRPAVVVDLSVLDALDPAGASNRPSWSPPLPERRPIPPIVRRRQFVAEPEEVPATPTPPPSALQVPAEPLVEPPETPRILNVRTAPVQWRRPVPVTAGASLIQPVGARSTPPTSSPSDKLIDANVDVEATAHMISALPIGDGFRMLFLDDGTALSDNAERLLDILVEQMGVRSDLRLSVLAYAGGSLETAPRSRQLSLERALAVRNYLSERGVRGSRIDLRALGNTYVDGPPERVDLLLVE